MTALAKQDEPIDYASGLMAVIERSVRDPSVDIDKMERLLAMQERVMADAAKRAFTAAFRAAKSEMQPVVRNKRNEQTKSNYADLEAIADAIDPIIDAHGFALTFGSGTADLPDHYRVTCDALHEAGHERHYFADVPADMVGMKGNQNKTATHGFGSTMSYGRRYLKLLIFDIATKDDRDGNGSRRIGDEGYQMISADQCAELRRLIASAKVTEEAFCQRIDLGTLPELAATNFEGAKSMLVKRIETIRGQANAN
jgi:hypothetical protein